VQYLKRNAIWLVPILLMALLTPFSPWIDLSVAKWTYHPPLTIDSLREPTNFSSSLFYDFMYKFSFASGKFSSNIFFDFIYKYGVVPAQITCTVATLVFIFSFFRPKLIFWRIPALVISLNLIIGSGIVSHLLLKETWGRPRPKQVIEFGGLQKFHPFYIPAIKPMPEPCKSFPSGHSTTGFYFFCLYFLGKRYNKKALELGGLFLGITLGGMLSIARIMQGGHFVSDVLMAAFIMWETAYFVDLLIFDCLKCPEFCNKPITK
jgi:lipid A 4'-phosphatase